MNARLNSLRDYLRAKVQLKTPEEETDNIYKFEDEDLDRILLDAIKQHNPSYSLESLPREEEPFVLWLAEIEIYFSLASGNSRFYRISAEAGTEINRQQRVDHYMKLIEGRQRHYDTMWAQFTRLNPSQIETGDVYVKSPQTISRAWRLSDRPSINLESVTVRSTSVDLQWTVNRRSKSKYTLFKNTDLIVDEWEVPVWSEVAFLPLTKNSEVLMQTIDPTRNKYRAKDLLPNTKYHFAIVVIDELGKWGYSEITVETEEE